MVRIKKIVFTGGGTGGHVYPALAIIEHLLDKFPDVCILWIGQHKGIERGIIEKEGLSYKGIYAGKFRRYCSIQNVFDLFKIIIGFFESLIILSKQKPDLVFGKGGFVTVPVIWAAFILRIPTYVHESDSDSGLANRLVSYVVNKIFVPYEETKSTFANSVRHKIFVSGNPIRKQFFDTDASRARAMYNLREEQDFLLVLGGSMGSEEVNQLVQELVPSLPQDCFILHQMGDKLYKKSTLKNYETVPFLFKNLSDLISASTLVISRAGAGSVWELSVLGAVVIYIPLKQRGDQVRNAALLERLGACISLPNEKDRVKNLRMAVFSLLNDKKARKAMSMAAQKVVRADASEYLVQKIIEKIKK